MLGSGRRMQNSPATRSSPMPRRTWWLSRGGRVSSLLADQMLAFTMSVVLLGIPGRSRDVPINIRPAASISRSLSRGLSMCVYVCRVSMPASHTLTALDSVCARRYIAETDTTLRCSRACWFPRSSVRRPCSAALAT